MIIKPTPFALKSFATNFGDKDTDIVCAGINIVSENRQTLNCIKYNQAKITGAEAFSLMCRGRLRWQLALCKLIPEIDFNEKWLCMASRSIALPESMPDRNAPDAMSMKRLLMSVAIRAPYGWIPTT